MGETCENSAGNSKGTPEYYAYDIRLVMEWIRK